MYDRLARFYDAIHAELTEDIGFVLTHAARAGGPVVELGCGTGRLLIPLARAGITVLGVDESAPMLALAEKHLSKETAACQSRITLQEASINSYAGSGFAMAIIGYNTLMHIPRSAQLPMLRHIATTLAPGGQLLIDVSNPFLIAATPNDRLVTLERAFKDESTGQEIMQFASNWIDEERQVLTITWLFDGVAPAGGPIERTTATVDYQYSYPHQLELTLMDAGFEVDSIWGDYNETPFEEDAPRFLLLAKRT